MDLDWWVKEFYDVYIIFLGIGVGVCILYGYMFDEMMDINFSVFDINIRLWNYNECKI